MTPDGRRALSASGDKTLRIWDLESGESLRTLEGHTDPVNAVAVTSDGRRALSASEDKTLRIWDLESGESLRTLEGHTGWVTARGCDLRRAPRRLGARGTKRCGSGTWRAERQSPPSSRMQCSVIVPSHPTG